jgi:CMP-N,N'-diacetyllegionaminic acid synthase
MSANRPQILCIIPARSGSKGLAHKNVREFRGKPMLAWSIEHARRSKHRDRMRVIVSTDSQDYADIARAHGAETPFLRPAHLAGDFSTDYECLWHAVDWLRENEGYRPDVILHLRPTQPCRTVEHVDRALDMFLSKRSCYDSLRSVIPVSKSPYKMYELSGDQPSLTPLFTKRIGDVECFNQCRQVLPQCYLHNGYVDILNASVLENGSVSGTTILPYIMSEEDDVDIDRESDIPLPVARQNESVPG